MGSVTIPHMARAKCQPPSSSIVKTGVDGSPTRGRLAAAATELYVERGFEQTTAANIAERAGLTERTFLRHFADKREVLFFGQEDLQELFVSAVAQAPLDMPPFAAVAEIRRRSHRWSPEPSKL